MRLFFLILVVISLSTRITVSQNELHDSNSLKFHLTLNPFISQNYLFLEQGNISVTNMWFLDNMISDSPSIQQISRLMLLYPSLWQTNNLFSPAEMINPLSVKYLRENKNSEINYIFGLFQTAAVGYLAIKHISKYGFLKEKEKK